MKIALVAHGYPPELVGGTELAVQGLARGLANRGHEVLVIAGSMDHSAGFRVSRTEDVDAGTGARVRVVRIHRADLFFDHWQKSASGKVARAFSALLEEERPDLVHVHHWIRLSDDLVARAAACGIPACVTLHDLWTSCLVAFRVRTGSNEFCQAPLAPVPCLDCAAGRPPRTPWLEGAAAARRLAERRATLLRELSLARCVTAPSKAHAAALGQFLGLDEGQAVVRVVPHGRDLHLKQRSALPPPLEHGRLELASWGHLHPLKGQDLLLHALAKLSEPPKTRTEGPLGMVGPVRLHLLGAEPDAGFATQLRRQAEGLDVVFHGAFCVDDLDHHPGTRVHAMLSGSRAHESWGLVLDEAVALGLPSILPRSGAFPERLGRGALFYAPSDADDLAKVIKRLCAPGAWAELRADLPPLETVVPTMETHVAALLGVYDDVLSAAAPAAPLDLLDPQELDRRELDWDAELSLRSAQELGFEEPDAAPETPQEDTPP